MRKSYGFRTFHVTEIALYHALGKLPEPDVAGVGATCGHGVIGFSCGCPTEMDRRGARPDLYKSGRF
jgi:hypothetical protein